MLHNKEIEEIREHLNKAQNPLFFFDNDNDGLISFLLLRRYIGRGKGVAIKSYPDLNMNYFKKVEELHPDYLFILDKPVVSVEFLNKVLEAHIPIVWIDHHNSHCDVEEVFHYDPQKSSGSNEPVSYMSYIISGRKEDIWLAVIGCISDALIPDFYNEFLQKFPHLGKKQPQSAFDLLYNSEIGTIARILDFSLKDSTTHVVNMIKFMTGAKGPMDIFEENSRTEHILQRYKEVNKKYQDLLEKARKHVDNKIIYFHYGGQLSLSSNIANQLMFEYPNKIVVVVYLNGNIANISLRGNIDVRALTLKAIEDIEGASGGGHTYATGAKMSVDYLPKFKENLEKLIREF